MKFRKMIALALVAVSACTAFVFAGCDSNDGDKQNNNNHSNSQNQGTEQTPGNTEIKHYTLEAEYIDLDDAQGSGISSDQGGVQMIYGEGTDVQKAKGWSNGYYVGYTYSANLALDFVFESDTAATTTIILRLGSELGSITLDPSIFAVKLNGTAIPYGSLYVENSSDYETMKFYDCTVTANAQLKAGTNTVTLVVLSNDLIQGDKTGGPTIDCLKLDTTAEITWTPKTENVSDRDSGPF